MIDGQVKVYILGGGGQHSKRLPVLIKELEEQGVANYEIVGSVHDTSSIRKTINASHRSMVQRARDEGLSKVVCMEDDIRFTDVGAWDYYLENEPDDYDIYFGGIYLGKIVDGIVKSFSAMHCYCVHERFYDIFLSVDKEKHIDEALSGLGKYWVSDPMIAVQHNGISDSSQTYCNFDSITSSRKLYKKQTKLTNACT